MQSRQNDHRLDSADARNNYEEYAYDDSTRIKIAGFGANSATLNMMNITNQNLSNRISKDDVTHTNSTSVQNNNSKVCSNSSFVGTPSLQAQHHQSLSHNIPPNIIPMPKHQQTKPTRSNGVFDFGNSNSPNINN